MIGAPTLNPRAGNDRQAELRRRMLEQAMQQARSRSALSRFARQGQSRAGVRAFSGGRGGPRSFMAGRPNFAPGSIGPRLQPRGHGIGLGQSIPIPGPPGAPPGIVQAPVPVDHLGEISGGGYSAPPFVPAPPPPPPTLPQAPIDLGGSRPVPGTPINQTTLQTLMGAPAPTYSAPDMQALQGPAPSPTYSATDMQALQGPGPAVPQSPIDFGGLIPLGGGTWYDTSSGTIFGGGGGGFRYM